MKDFQNKVVAITGGATGIGFALAKQFGQDGAKLALAGRRRDRLDQAVEELGKAGIEAAAFECDVVKLADVEKFADDAWAHFGAVDVIVNNAGTISPPSNVTETSLADAKKVIDINFWGVWNGSAVFGRRFAESGKPALILNVGSENSLFNGVPRGASYVASKHAVLALTEALREEMPPEVGVGLICPGFVRSELGDPDAMAAGMDTDKYAAIALQQIKNEEFFIVSHAYNIVRINERYDAVSKAYATYAPRYDGDVEFDVRTLIGLRQEQA